MAWWRRRTVTVTNLKDTGVVGQPVQFDIDASGAGKGRPEVVINGGTTRCLVVARGDHKYQASFTPQEARRHFIQLKFNGRKLPKDPFKIDICPGPSRPGPPVTRPRPPGVTASGPGLQGEVAINQQTSFQVDTGDRRSQVLVTITSPSGCHIEHYILDKGNGTFVVEYTPSKRGTYTIEVTCDRKVVSGKSFSVEANYPVSVSTVSSYYVGQRAEFEVDTSLAGDGDLEVTIILRSGDIIPSTTTRLQAGLYVVTFTPLSLEPTYAQILFNSHELAQSPLRLDCDTRVEVCSSNYENLPQPLRRPDTHTGPGVAVSCCDEDLETYAVFYHRDQSPDQSSARHDEDESVDDRHDYVNVPGPSGDHVNVPDETVRDYLNVLDFLSGNDELSQSPREDYSYTATPAASEEEEEEEEEEETYENTALQYPGIRDDIAQSLHALRGCLSCGVQLVYIVRSGLVADVFELYKDKDVASKILRVEFVGESGTKSVGLTRELLASFWRQVAEDLFRGEDCLVPDLALFRVRKEAWKFECLGRILSHTVALTGNIPSFLARSTLVTLTADAAAAVDDDCLMDDFLLFVTPRERALLTKAMRDYGTLTAAESDRLVNFYTAHGFNKMPKALEVKEQVLTIAHEDLVEKPASLVSRMRQGIPDDHRAAFWQGLSAGDVAHILEAQRPTPEKVAAVIVTPEEDMTGDQDTTLYYLKEFVAGLDCDTLADFLIFVTGSVHQPDKINVTFTTLTGLDRRPISHTCFNQLDVPTTYGSMKEFRREFLSVLASPESLQYSEL